MTTPFCSADEAFIRRGEHIRNVSAYFLSLLFQDFYRIISDGHGAVEVFRF